MKKIWNCKSIFRVVQRAFFLSLLFGLGLQSAKGQTSTISLDDLSYFRDPGRSWKIAGEVVADLEKVNKLEVGEGKGILVNLPGKKSRGEDLYTRLEHADLDLELDFLMALGSNSGIYLQGMYELQLKDSWGIQNVSAAQNGGIYERWDESRPAGQKGYQGNAPRQNVGRAPGLWQHLKVSFQAPRFDSLGNKIENARIVRAELNGVVIHENVELLGPTRGAMSEEEKPRGPLRFQGDHGAVAFRNIKIVSFEKPRPELDNLRYTVYEGKFDELPSFDSLPPEAEGTSVILSSELENRSKQFLIRYQGILKVLEEGEYTFRLNVPGGGGLLKIDQQEVIPFRQDKGTIHLPAGNFAFELLYSKHMDWVEPGLGLSVSAPDLREYLISEGRGPQRERVDPILVNPGDKKILRSFMDIPEGPRFTHAVSVGNPLQLHYTYDLDHGSLLQAWRGGFLDATPMWHDRGNGSSRPQGSVEYFMNQPRLTLARLSSAQEDWPADTTGSSYQPKGYKMDKEGQPIFRYLAYATMVEDVVRVLEGGKGLQRNIRIHKPADELYVRLASGSKIKEVKKGLYMVDGNAYYLRLDKTGKEKPLVRTTANGEELIVPAVEELTYSILF